MITCQLKQWEQADRQWMGPCESAGIHYYSTFRFQIPGYEFYALLDTI